MGIASPSTSMALHRPLWHEVCTMHLSMLRLRPCSEMGAIDALGVSGHPLGFQLQFQMYNIIVEELNGDWSKLRVDRLKLFKMHIPYPLPLAVDTLISNLHQFKLEHKLIVIRSIANGWATSSRYHEQVQLPCVFGCCHVHPVQSIVLSHRCAKPPMINGHVADS